MKLSHEYLLGINFIPLMQDGYVLYFKKINSVEIYISLHFHGESNLDIFIAGNPPYNKQLDECTIEEFVNEVFENSGIDVNERYLDYQI